MQSPAHTVRIGNITGTIWDNQSNTGPWYSTEIVRNYKDNNGQWAKASNFRLSDLPVVATVSKCCLDWILANTKDGRTE